MARKETVGVLRRGDHLVTDTYGDAIWASEARTGRWGPQRGRLVHKDEVDLPGVGDIKRAQRTEKQPRVVTRDAPGIEWRYRDENGDLV